MLRILDLRVAATSSLLMRLWSCTDSMLGERTPLALRFRARWTGTSPSSSDSRVLPLRFLRVRENSQSFCSRRHRAHGGTWGFSGFPRSHLTLRFRQGNYAARERVSQIRSYQDRMSEQALQTGNLRMPGMFSDTAALGQQGHLRH